jgi:hypothetical protein
MQTTCRRHADAGNITWPHRNARQVGDQLFKGWEEGPDGFDTRVFYQGSRLPTVRIVQRMYYDRTLDVQLDK